MKRFLCALAGGLALLAITCPGVAGPRVEADPNKLYPITPDVGPWVISAASYMGPNARQLAREVVFQLRRRDNLPAYFYDYSEEEQKKLADYLKDRPPPPPGKKRWINIQDQCGVLIGGFADQDSARKMLADVKKLKMPDLDNKCFDSIVNPNDGRIYYMSPFANAFVTRNPTVAHTQQANSENDPSLKPLNANEDYSLLKNKHPWTLAIKDYPGVSMIQSGSASPSFMEKLWSGAKTKDVLGASGATAHNLAETLKKMGFDAYVLHTRRTSIVTVGGFDDKDDPSLEETRVKLERMRQRNMQMANGTDLLQLYQPLIPMRVPKP
jgi:hypothetical protein